MYKSPRLCAKSELTLMFESGYNIDFIRAAARYRSNPAGANAGSNLGRLGYGAINLTREVLPGWLSDAGTGVLERRQPRTEDARAGRPGRRGAGQAPAPLLENQTVTPHQAMLRTLLLCASFDSAGGCGRMRA